MNTPAGDPHAPYARLAVVGVIGRERATAPGATGASGSMGASGSAGASDLAVSGAATNWLLLHRVWPFDAWDPPGGRMEPGEDLQTAVRREVLEETGLRVAVAGPCYAFLTFYKEERLLAVSMACRPLGDPDVIKLEPDGSADWRWVTALEWERLAAAGHSSWDPQDVRRVTRMAETLWETEG